ncbi:MAG: hypothetical protein DWQ07_13405 [Chloroflexi bacterium]|nr:MAG: hypothetical protein DWQ07_13405 [Chloroflexota bacterium]MBL1196767.1 hypothetical protein [Chloroflexota bacterium]NOH14061.1 hypothetical protein [Chloroflexota bacterium]
MKGSLFLIHWHEAEAEAHAEMLRRTDWQVEIECEDGARAAKKIKNKPPNAVIIYLTRLASHGRHTATHLRESASTRELPIIFVGGNPEAVQQSRTKVPDGVFISEEELRQALVNIAKQT